MQSRWFLVCCLAFLVISVPVLAQEGHPVVGTWHGNFGPNPNQRTDVTIVMDWDSKQITGILNPGPGSSSLQNARLDPENWTLHFEADAKDAAGRPVHYVVDGKFEDLGSWKRSLVGTWSVGAQKNDFKLTRDE